MVECMCAHVTHGRRCKCMHDTCHKGLASSNTWKPCVTPPRHDQGNDKFDGRGKREKKGRKEKKKIKRKERRVHAGSLTFEW